MMNDDIVKQLNSLVISLQDLIKSQGDIEVKLITMIEDSEKRSIHRSEESESRLSSRLETFIREVKADIRDPLKTLLNKHVGQEYLETKRRGIMNILQGLGFMIFIGFGGTFITIMIDTSDNKKSIVQNSADIKSNFEKIDKLEKGYYTNFNQNSNI
jgi:hypothetical protein